MRPAGWAQRAGQLCSSNESVRVEYEALDEKLATQCRD
jgi:hypothetical protein